VLEVTHVTSRKLPQHNVTECGGELNKTGMPQETTLSPILVLKKQQQSRTANHIVEDRCTQVLDVNSPQELQHAPVTSALFN
jgi:hypothetical protein